VICFPYKKNKLLVEKVEIIVSSSSFFVVANVPVARNVGELKPNIYPPLETKLKVIKIVHLKYLAPIFFATC